MAQSALTVTPPSPTPPTNLSSTGATGPNPPNLTKATYADWADNTKFDSAPPPYFDDGVPAPTATLQTLNETAASYVMQAGRLTFAANTAALASGTGATSGGTEGTYPGTDTTPNDGPNVGPVPASSSVAHEGAGTETLFTQTYPSSILAPIPLTTVGDGPAMPAPSTAAAWQPTNHNAAHASSLSPATAPTLTNITPGNSVSGVGVTTLGVTGTGFTRQSVVYVNGVAQATTFVSATSLTCAAVVKRTTAGTWPVTVVTGGVITTAAVTWTFT